MIFRNETQILNYSFNSKVASVVKEEAFGRKWPVVYIIECNGKNLAYIGETTNLSNRTSQHWANTERQKLKNIHVIHNASFNKSVVLDLETFLIKYMSADGKYKLQNGNGGQQVHSYYQRKEYQEEFRTIWQLLKKNGIVSNYIHVIENTDLFKYSPYKTLTPDQYEISRQFIENLKEDLAKGISKRVSLINGGAGTGKSILGIFLLKLLVDVQEEVRWTIEEETLDENLNAIIEGLPNLKIGYVVPMKNFRKTLKKVFKNIKGFKSSMVLSPADVANSKEIFDLLIVDESHRLRRRQSLSGPGDYKAFDKKNQEFGLGEDGTELDWILEKSRYQFFFYDADQSIKPTDVPKKRFDLLIKDNNTRKYKLQSQLRCKGGNDYIQYLHDIFDCLDPERIHFNDYEFKLFEDVGNMVNTIIQKDKDVEIGLCRNIAGYAWEWITKDKTLDEIRNEGLYDIDICGHKYVWNMCDTDWINSPNSVNEIGCIHTTQGFDLNFAGVILGPEISYDKVNHEIIVDKKLYKDAKAKENIVDNKELLAYIKNIYITMLERGIRGTYIYVCDPHLREYLKNFMDIVLCNTVKETVVEMDIVDETAIDDVVGETAIVSHIIIGQICDDSEVIPELKYIEYLPFYSLKAACGYFGEGEEVTIKGWMQIPPRYSADRQLFVIQAIGDSMLPRICNGDYCIFRAKTQGSKIGKIVLAQHSSIADPYTGGSYTIKEYHSEKVGTDDETWAHTKIDLKPLNSEYSPISILVESSDDFKIIGELVDIIKKE